MADPSVAVAAQRKKTAAQQKRNGSFRKILSCWQLYVLLVPAIAYFAIFRYIPMAGIQIAFRDFNPVDGMFHSPWVGLENFRRFFASNDFWLVIKNTLGISVLNLLFGFPIPIVLALLLNQTRAPRYKKVVQTTMYMPYFISAVVIAGMIKLFLSPSSGFINKIIELFGGEAVMFMGKPQYFWAIYVISEIWQNTGYNSIVYIAALAAVSPELHESAVVDGASTWQRIWYIDFPSILPTAIILLIMNAGRVLTIGFEKIYLLQNELNRSSSEVLSTFVYKTGFGALTGLSDFSYAGAVGLFESVISLIILYTVNKIAGKVSETSLL